MLSSNTSFHRRSETVLIWGLRGLAIISSAIVLLILFFLVWEAIPMLRQVGLLRFFSDASWHPASNEFNLAPMLAGTLLVTLASVLLATPLGILSAVFCHYYAPPAIA